MAQTAIALPINDKAVADNDNSREECGNFRLLQLTVLHSEKNLQSLALLRLIIKSPSICPPFRVRHPRGLFYSVL